MKSLLIRNALLVDADGERTTDILIRDGTVELVAEAIPPSDDEEFDAEGLLALPALIDCHVHFREPGLEHKATMASEAAAAVSGGVGTVCEMPNTKPPTVTVVALADKVRRASGIEACDIRFFFGATEPAHVRTLRELFTGDSAELTRLRSRCCGLKLYFDHSTGNQGADDVVIDEAFAACAELGIVAVCHCEDSEMNHKAREAVAGSDVRFHSDARPPESEAIAIERAIGLSRKHGTRLHVAHLSTSFGIDLVRGAKADGLPVTCEVAPHHLFLTVDDYAALGTLAKMNPPLRPREHRDALWKGIGDRTVDCVATDHAPHTLEEKRSGNPLDAPSGVPGVELTLPLLLTVAAGKWPHPTDKRPAVEFGYADIARLCFENPNRIFGLGKTGVAEGSPASLLLVDPKADATIAAKKLKSACGWSPYDGWKVRGSLLRFLRA